MILSETIEALVIDWTDFQTDIKRKKRAHRKRLHFWFHIADLRYKKLFLFVSNLNMTGDENGFIDHSYVLPLKCIIVGPQNNVMEE